MLDRALTSQLPPVPAGRPPDVEIVLPGEPKGKGRPRSRIVRKASGDQFIAVYNPEETRNYEATLKMFAAQAMRGRPPFSYAIKLHVIATFPIPSSWSGKRQRAALEGMVRPCVRPDIDNIVKMIDALNHLVWVDDRQICDLTVEKHYGMQPSLLLQAWEQRGLLL